MPELLLIGPALFEGGGDLCRACPTHAEAIYYCGCVNYMAALQSPDYLGHWAVLWSRSI